MAEPVVLSSLLLAALRLVMKRRIHFVFMGLLGFIAAIGYSLSEKLLLSPPQDLKDIATFLGWLTEEKTFLFTLGMIALGISLIEAIVRGPLLLVLEETLLGESKNEKRPLLSLPTLLKGIWTSFTLTFLYIAVSVLLIAITFFPVFLAATKNQAALPGIFQFSLLVFIGLSILFYFIKEFALFYALLGRVPVKSALELGYGLFRQHLLPSLLFGLLLVGLSLIFTFILDSAIIISATLGGDDLFSALVPIFLLSGIFGLFEQLVRLLFFHNLAAPKKKEKAPEKIASPGEIPETAV